ncbi:MAG: ABC-F family ATP-binding cassette domain-containing protein [Elusimicrobia bacterium]|nr:ABC-F family ATP-binding cassette domain-containing protein [Elusimicrobiota bacterium]
MAILLSSQNLSKSFGARPLFENLSFGLFEGERTGLIGSNGGGKSTLLKILAGLETPDEGLFSPRRGVRVGYLPQHDRCEDAAPGLTVRDAAAHSVRDLGLEGWDIDRRGAGRAGGRCFGRPRRGQRLRRARQTAGEARSRQAESPGALRPLGRTGSPEALAEVSYL